jgi:hypothetical protein
MIIVSDGIFGRALAAFSLFRRETAYVPVASNIPSSVVPTTSSSQLGSDKSLFRIGGNRRAASGRQSCIDHPNAIFAISLVTVSFIFSRAFEAIAQEETRKRDE